MTDYTDQSRIDLQNGNLSIMLLPNNVEHLTELQYIKLSKNKISIIYNASKYR
jgi:Leucine-rich repeat (LRR) protein